jgi:hypothetical protein
MQQRMVTIILLIGLSLGLAVLVSGSGSWRLPDNQQGYTPEQPIAFSHRLHAGELGMDCRFCHWSADKSRHAGIPSTDVCMKCHKFIMASNSAMKQEMDLADKEKRQPQRVVSAELRKLFNAAGLDESLKLDTENEPDALEWVRVHNLPDYVYFDHRSHVAAGVSCQKCHGPVESMEQVRQHSTLSMGWCVNCHRESNANGVNGNHVHASLDCTTCHF